MPAWLFPALKAVLPHVGTILSAAAPVFTKKSADAAPNQTSMLQQQVTELQAAVAKNDTHIKDLAMQMRTTLEALEQGAALAEHRYQRLLTMCLATGVVAAVSLALVVILLLQ
jgi:Flp pilus assembly protein TadB